jgi:hypothetical protein
VNFQPNANILDSASSSFARECPFSCSSIPDQDFRDSSFDDASSPVLGNSTLPCVLLSLRSYLPQQSQSVESSFSILAVCGVIVLHTRSTGSLHFNVRTYPSGHLLPHECGHLPSKKIGGDCCDSILPSSCLPLLFNEVLTQFLCLSIPST